MDSILRILILVGITFSNWVATLNNEAINTQNYEERQSGQLCPPMTYKEKYEVVFIENGIQMYGCASLDHNRKVSDVPMLHFWYEVPIDSNVKPTYCKNINNMVPYIFKCMSKTEPTNKEEIDKGLKYMSLYQYPTQYVQINITNIPSYRCVVFVAEEYADHGIMEIRMAFSDVRAKSYDKTQCEGLSYMLLNKDMIYDVEKLNKWPEGASYVFMTGNLPPKISITKKITTTTARPPFTFYDFLYVLSHHRI